MKKIIVYILIITFLIAGKSYDIRTRQEVKAEALKKIEKEQPEEHKQTIKEYLEEVLK